MAALGPSRVQTVIENVHDAHESDDTLQIRAALRFSDGHNIAKCASRRA